MRPGAESRPPSPAVCCEVTTSAAPERPTAQAPGAAAPLRAVRACRPVAVAQQRLAPARARRSRQRASPPPRRRCARRRQVVGDEQVARPRSRLQLAAQQVEDLRLYRHVQRRGRLVADQTAPGLHRQRARDGDALALPPENSMRVAFCSASACSPAVHQGDMAGRAAASPGCRAPSCLRRASRTDTHTRVQRRERVLEDDLDLRRAADQRPGLAGEQVRDRPAAPSRRPADAHASAARWPLPIGRLAAADSPTSASVSPRQLERHAATALSQPRTLQKPRADRKCTLRSAPAAGPSAVGRQRRTAGRRAAPPAPGRPARRRMKGRQRTSRRGPGIASRGRPRRSCGITCAHVREAATGPRNPIDSGGTVPGMAFATAAPRRSAAGKPATAPRAYGCFGAAKEHRAAPPR